jgi:hypothetical protein
MRLLPPMSSGIARSRAPTKFLARMKSVSAQETWFWKKHARFGFDFIQDRQLCADVFFVRAQLTIRADGPPSAQAL